MTESVTIPELRTMVEIVSRLAANLQHLCQTQTVFRVDMADEYRGMTRRAAVAFGAIPVSTRKP
jgi:hypothetical protein